MHEKTLMSQILTPEDAFSNEKLRGVVTSIVSGIASNALNIVGTQVMGLDIQTSSILFMYIVGNILGYSSDIVFAKYAFRIEQKGGKIFDGPVAYGDYKTRFKWLWKSFFRRQFFRYMITILIDTLVSLSLLKWVIQELDRRDIQREFKYRNVIVAGFVAIFTFFLYTNVLRFDWAYSDKEIPMMNIVVMMWVTIVLMIYASSYTAALPTKPSVDNKYTPIVASIWGA